jgi:xylose isomerase
MRHFDYKPSRTEDETGVWASVQANMRTYLLLKERAAAFRADPEVQQALADAKVAELSVPTLAEGEGYAELLADRGAFEEFDTGAYYAGKGFGFVRLQQLATEHLLGAR